MASIQRTSSVRDYQEFVKTVYNKPNDLHYGLSDMLNNVQRFSMRALKGIRKGDKEKTRINLTISMGWFMSTLNRLHIDLEESAWKRFPYICSYCGTCPRECKEGMQEERFEGSCAESKKPLSIKGFQKMYEEIYPSRDRTLEHAGVHLAEEIGEFSEAILAYRGQHMDEQLKNIHLEAADVFSCFMGIFNSLNIDFSKELAIIFAKNCHECNEAPCICDFTSVMNYES